MLMVIDFHQHVGTKENWTPWVIEYFRQNNPFYFNKFSDRITPEDVVSHLISQGVTRAVILAEYAPQTTGEVTNEFVADFCRDRDELIPFASICLYNNIPPEVQAVEALDKLKVKGFKMLPSYAHFYPNAPEFFPFYELCQSANVPIMFHTGTSIFRGSRIKYSDPILLDDVAEEFPSLKILLEHGGRTFWYDRAAWMVARHKNVYIGIAGIPTRNLPVYFPNLEKYQDRFVFGSDWPGIPEIKALVERIYQLPFKDKVKEKILWENASYILGLS